MEFNDLHNLKATEYYPINFRKIIHFNHFEERSYYYFVNSYVKIKDLINSIAYSYCFY